jgi:hypothetical protein
MIVPLIICGAYVVGGRGPVANELAGKELPPVAAWDISSLFSFFLPGDYFSLAAGDIPAGNVLRLSEDIWITHPAYVTQFPLALCGFVLSFFLLFHLKTSRAARFLAVGTFAVLILAFTPGVTYLTAGLVTWKMVHRLTWIIPWGLTVAFFMSRIRLPAIHTWIILLLIVLGLARGDPRTLVKSLRRWQPVARPPAEAVDAFRVLDSQPSPQGIVLASQPIGRMLPAYVPDAYPAVYRGSGTATREIRRSLLAQSRLTDVGIRQIEDMNCRYILLEKKTLLNVALRREPSIFHLVYANQGYNLWKVSPEG